MSREIPRFLLLAVPLVTAPRLILFFFQADGVSVAGGWYFAAVVLSGLGSAVALTGGQIYLAARISRKALDLARGVSDRARSLGVALVLLAVWALVVAMSTVLMGAHLASMISRESFRVVLEPTWIRDHAITWTVAVFAVAAVELIAAGIAAAHTDAELDDHLDLEAERDALHAETLALGEQMLGKDREIRDLRAALQGAKAAANGEQGDDNKRRRKRRYKATCSAGCGWSKTYDSELSATRGKAAHAGSCPAKEERS